MARNASRITAAALAVGVMGPLLVWIHPAGAQPSPGVPCMDLVQHLAAEPPSVPDALATAANVLDGAVPAEPPNVPALPVAEVVHGITALTAPGPVPVPVDLVAPAVVEAAPLAHAAAAAPPGPIAAPAAPAGPAVMPPVPAAVPPVPVAVPAVAEAGPAIAAPVIPEASAVAPPADTIAASSGADEAVVPAPAATPPEPVGLESIPDGAVQDAVEVAALVPEAHAPPVVAPESAPVLHAAGGPGLAPAPGPVPPVVPAGMPVTAPALSMPAVPLGDAFPALPLLPATLPMPTDLICEGTAWSAGATDAGENPPETVDAVRAEQW
ncbi:hypothetical protein [Mycobacterium sp. SMC-4]|uniref:hypothetical protein n=1 Tax=Mycobacterium sp. SMC-4 TaxID=2857059 RepID=UPI0021B2B3E0|nr:hypothetical protein [Mycobacterium sp. SMC-4]UXA20383.1 hypothetical protein KXD98_12920 [Mycobacterium sp. SMC-4]